MAKSSAERRFFRDAALPGRGASVIPTPTGDWPTVSGEQNLKGAVIRRIVTFPGEMTHRGGYGAGLTAQIETPSLPIRQARLTAAILDNLTRESRVESARVAISEDPTEPSLLYVDVTFQPIGDDESLAVVAELET